MASQGANNPSASLSDGSWIDWTNPTNVYLSDNVYTTVVCPARNVRDTSNHISTGFGFTIPTGATINGIMVEVERKKSTAVAGTSCFDNNISLTKDGASSTGSTVDTNAWSTTEQYQTFGDATDLWNTTWTPAEVNDANFGFMFSAVLAGSATSGITASVDHVRITVYYTAAVTARRRFISN
jgi:hypothetical protein